MAPPIPRKKLTRTLSLPGSGASSPPPLPRPPWSPVQRRYLNFDNPLYMTASCVREEGEGFAPAADSTFTSPSFSQLSFHTSDEHLCVFFQNFADQNMVSQRLQHRHLLFLRSTAQAVEARWLQKGAAGGVFGSRGTQDFLQCQANEPKRVGDQTFYRLHSSRFPERVLGLRVRPTCCFLLSMCSCCFATSPSAEPSVTCRSLSTSASVQPKPRATSWLAPSQLLQLLSGWQKLPWVSFHLCLFSVPPQVCTPKSEASSAQTQVTPPHANVRDVIVHFQSAAVLTQSCSHPLHPAGSGCSTSESPSTVLSLLKGGFSVSLERDLPLATLEDFVQDSLQRPGSSGYCRQVCVLLLQILMGSQHLHSNSGAAAELNPREIFLVWPRRPDGGRNQATQEVNEQKRGIQLLWKTWGSPRLVLTPKSSPVAEPLVYIKHQVGALIDFCLLPLESPAAVRPGPASSSFYQKALRHLSSLLQKEGDLQMTNAAATLQVLLWGPQGLHPSTVTVHHWLMTKQALLVMQMAEAGLKQEQLFPDWEDCMRLQFLAFTDPETVASVAAQLWESLNKEAQV